MTPTERALETFGIPQRRAIRQIARARQVARRATDDFSNVSAATCG